jgi:hypothetical protein
MARLCHNLGLRLGGSLAKDGAANADLGAAHGDGALKVLAHAHAQLQLPVQPQLLDHQIPLLGQQLEVLILILGRGGHAPGNGTNGHQSEEMQVGAVVDDGPTERDDVLSRRTPGLGFLARRVHLDVDVDFLCIGLGLDLLAPVLVEELCLLEVVDTRDTPEVRDFGEVLAAACVMSVSESISFFASPKTYPTADHR